MISLPADLIISITIPDDPAALPVFIFMKALEIISVKYRGGPAFGCRSGESLSHINSTFSSLA